MQKLGINIDAFDDINSPKSVDKNTENYIKTIANLGFGAAFSDITFGKAPEEVAELCAKHGLEYQFVHGPFRRCNVLWETGLAGDDYLQNLISCAEHCHNANVPIMIVHSSSGFTPPPVSRIGNERFERLIDFANKKNVKIAFENLRVLSHIEWAMKKFDNCENVGFCWDTGHENCFTRGIDFMSLFGHKLICTHIHDNYKELGGDRHMIPFDGKINFESVAKRLKNCDYSGPLMLEVLARDEIYNNMPKEEFLQRAYNSIKKLQDMILSCE